MIPKIRALLRRTDQRGTTTLELALWAVPMLLLIGLLIFGARITLAGNAVQSAAEAAARDATLTRSSAGAQAAGQDAATYSLNSNGINCIQRSVAIDTSGYNQPIGTIGTVNATISCTVNLSDAGLPFIPGTMTIARDAKSPVDPYRQR